MRKKKSIITQAYKGTEMLITCALMTCVLFCHTSMGSVESESTNSQDNNARKDTCIRIYLPRKVTIQDNYLKLGQVSIVRGDESLVAKVNEIALGRFSMPGQEIVIDRSTLLSRLACNGIPPSIVTMTGAEEIAVKKQHKIITSSEFVKSAYSFLKKNLSTGSGCQAEPLRIPKDLLLPVLDKDVILNPRMVESGTRNQAKVRISVLADSNEIGSGEVTFRLKFNCHTAVTLVEIPAGAVISPENVKIGKIVSDYPEPANWSPPYGLITRRALPVNTAIQPDMVIPAKPAVSIKRNETVVIRIDMPGLLVTALGKAMQQGHTGECIKVRNIDSQRIIAARIEEDGTVVPIF
jgi:flagella basal body P-ring formation protein FlgA